MKAKGIKKPVKQKIKEYFMVYPTSKLRVRQIERETGTPLPSVIKYARDLSEEKILKITEIGGARFYSADRSSALFFREKRPFNINLCYSSGLIDFLIHELDNPIIILFGSYSLGEDIEESDIDIYIEISKKNMPSLEKFEKRLKRKIQVFAYEKLEDLKNKELRNTILNGIVLNGFIEVFK